MLIGERSYDETTLTELSTLTITGLSKEDNVGVSYSCVVSWDNPLYELSSSSGNLFVTSRLSFLFWISRENHTEIRWNLR